jgi:hypothetical protein
MEWHETHCHTLEVTTGTDGMKGAPTNETSCESKEHGSVERIAVATVGMAQIVDTE